MTPKNIYTRKELFIIETYIADLHTSFYIPAICPEEAEYGRIVHLNAANYVPLRDDSAKTRGMGC